MAEEKKLLAESGFSGWDAVLISIWSNNVPYLLHPKTRELVYWYGIWYILQNLDQTGLKICTFLRVRLLHFQRSLC